MMRLLHTSDWHLGHTLRGLSREPEHTAFLAWLLDLLEEERPDALLVAGDVYDSASPSARAEQSFYDFLAEARRRLPGLDVVVVGGNHDSAARLESSARLLRSFGLHVVGALGHRRGEEPDSRLVVPLHRADGSVGAWVAAVPFLRAGDLGGEDPQVAVQAIYEQVLELARARQEPGQALLTTGHLTLVGAQRSEESERTIGTLGGLPDSIFPADLAYVALGHLHKAQAVGGRENVRYCGSPLPLSLAEADYRHEVRLVEIDTAGTFVRARPILVPRAVDMLRLPEAGPAPLSEVLERLALLPLASGGPLPCPLPFLEVRVRLDGPEPSLRRQVEEALSGKAARLIKLSVTSAELGPSLADQQPAAALEELDPRDVFARCYAKRYGGEPSANLRSAFAELLSQVGGQARPASAPAREVADDAVGEAALPGAPSPGFESGAA